MNLSFKELTESDLFEVKKIYDWFIAHSTATFHTEPIQVDQLKEFLYVDHPLYKSYLIYADKEIAGYCFLTNYKKRQAYDRTAELTIYLKPEFFGKGIGKIAVAHLEKVASEKGLKNLLAIITGDNDGSIALFKSCGYVQCADFKNVGEKCNKVLDVVAFQKQL
jgi:phosphinothricin acetyltransferase